MKDIFKKYKFVITIFTVISIVILVFLYFTVAEKGELWAYDLRSTFRMTPVDTDIVIVAIDDNTIRKATNSPDMGLGRYPWPRTAYGKALEFISKGKPELIVVDLNFEGENICSQNEYSDEAFINQIKHIPNLFFVNTLNIPQNEALININHHTGKQKSINKSGNKYKDDKSLSQLSPEARQKALQIMFPGIDDKYLSEHFIKVDDKSIDKNAVENKINYFEMPGYIEGLYKYARGIGINLVSADSDRVVRSYRPLYMYKGNYIPSLPLAVVNFLRSDNKPVVLKKNLLKIGNIEVPLNDELSFYLNWKIPVENRFNLPDYINYSTKSFSDVFFHEESSLNPDYFKNKIVLIGPTALLFKDTFKAPDRKVIFGVEILATAIDNLLNDKNFIVKAPLWLNLLTTLILLGLGFLFIYGFIRQTVRSSSKLYALITYLIVILLAYIFLNTILFTKYSLWLDLFFPSLIYIIVFSSVIAINSIIDRDKRSQLESTFSKYVSPQIYQTLLSDYKEVDLTAKRYEITVLFSDIRGFTPFTEELYPEEVAKYLNEYFNAMVSVILKHNGTIDKFMGDAIMAFFGAPLPDENHALNAARAALEMQKTLNALNNKWVKQGRRVINIGVGLNTGTALVGNFGSNDLMDFTVIGDAVNLGSRLESLNKETNTSILISAFTYEQIKDKVNVNVIGPKKVKGKSEAVVVYELVSLKEG